MIRNKSLDNEKEVSYLKNDYDVGSMAKGKKWKIHGTHGLSLERRKTTRDTT